MTTRAHFRDRGIGGALAEIILDAEISCAMRGLLEPGEFLEPEHWEEVRRRLQSTYRQATGEVDAVLIVQDRT